MLAEEFGNDTTIVGLFACRVSSVYNPLPADYRARLEWKMDSNDEKYLNCILDCLRTSATYKPKFGQRRSDGLALPEFQDLYRGDAFYNWFGLDNPAIYAAHKAAGGITSVYRQIGIGCERVFRQALQDTLNLSESDAAWSYETEGTDGRKRRLSLDGRIPLSRVRDAAARERVQEWMERSARDFDIEIGMFTSLTGAVFEVRQGYKSKDSKRQNADIENAVTAYTRSYLPCVAVLSNQIDGDVLARYRSAKWTVITGVLGLNDSTKSTYDFMRDVVGYDLAEFFNRNEAAIRSEVENVVNTLLQSGEP